MNREIRRGGPLAVTCIGLMFALACAPGDADRDDTANLQTETAAGRVVDDAIWMRDAVASDAKVFGTLHEANEFEIEAGKVAQEDARDAEVKAFARMMVDDHTRLQNEGDSLANSLNINPADAPEPMQNKHEQMLDSLRNFDDNRTGTTTGMRSDTGMARQGTTRTGTTGQTGTMDTSRAGTMGRPGTANMSFDQYYIDQQIRAHRGVLELINMSVQRPSNPTLQSTLESKVKPVVEQHLSRAEEIQRRLNGTAPSGR